MTNYEPKITDTNEPFKELNGKGICSKCHTPITLFEHINSKMIIWVHDNHSYIIMDDEENICKDFLNKSRVGQKGICYKCKKPITLWINDEKNLWSEDNSLRIDAWVHDEESKCSNFLERIYHLCPNQQMQSKAEGVMITLLEEAIDNEKNIAGKNKRIKDLEQKLNPEITKCKNCGHALYLSPFLGEWMHIYNGEEYHEEYIHICKEQCAGATNELCINPKPSNLKSKYSKHKTDKYTEAELKVYEERKAKDIERSKEKPKSFWDFFKIG